MGMFGLSKPNVERMKIKKDVKGLIKSLKHKDAEVRKCAAWALGEIKAIRAVEPLIQTYNDKDEDVRREATKALEKIRDGRDVDVLIHKALYNREVSKTKIKMGTIMSTGVCAIMGIALACLSITILQRFLKHAEVWYLYVPLEAFCAAIFITGLGLIVGGYWGTTKLGVSLLDMI